MKTPRIYNKNKTAGRPKTAKAARPGNVRVIGARARKARALRVRAIRALGIRAGAIRAESARRAAARNAYRAQIESLLEESEDQALADAWRRVSPFPMDSACELPNRRGMISDLADFAAALQPSLVGLKAERLCGLLERYAAYRPRCLDQAAYRHARRAGTLQHRGPGESSSAAVVTLRG